MATRSAKAVLGQNREIIVTWEGIVGNADDGAAVAVPHLPIKTVQMVGTRSDGQVTMEGSNDGGVTWATLHADDGAELTFATLGIEKMVENPLLIRPNGSAGSGDDLDIIMVCTGDR